MDQSVFFCKAPLCPIPKKSSKAAENGCGVSPWRAPDDFGKLEVREMIGVALMAAGRKIDPKAKRRLLIRSIAEKQRPRRLI